MEKITPLAKARAMNRILTALCEVYGAGACIHEQIMERNRYKFFVQPRQVGHYLSLTRLRGVTSTEVGEFWLRDHSTVLCSRDHIIAQLEYDRELKQRIEAVETRVRELYEAGDRPGMDHLYAAYHNAHGMVEWR